MKGNKKTHVSKKKVETLSELVKLAKENKTILIASIKGIPLSQYQEIAKKLRGKAVVKVPRKSLIIRMIDSIGNESAEKFKATVKESTAILFSNEDAFELAAELVNRKSPTKAKVGQESPVDVEVPEGPTDLVPGPAISELGALGIQIQITAGKIHIKEPKVIVRKGDKISAPAEAMMNKLNIRPFTVGFEPVSALDTKADKVYLEIKIDREGIVSEIKTLYGKALPFAVNLGYASPDTIKYLLQKASMQEKSLGKLFGQEVVKEESAESNSENSEMNLSINKIDGEEK